MIQIENSRPPAFLAIMPNRTYAACQSAWLRRRARCQMAAWRRPLAGMIVAALAARHCGLAGLDACRSSRPGGGSDRNYRVLRFPANAQLRDSVRDTPTAEQQLAADQLCCTYTRVELVSSGGGSSATLVTYDRDERSVSGGTFVAAAQDAVSQICSMSMGSRDCTSSEECMATAAATQPSNTSGLKTSRALEVEPQGAFRWLVSVILLRACLGDGGDGGGYI
jgi:hypothetical protein